MKTKFPSTLPITSFVSTKVLRANGPSHVFFFSMVIFLGSYYLLNIILAIVSMSYEQVCKEDQESEAQLAAALSVRLLMFMAIYKALNELYYFKRRKMIV